MKKRDTKNQLVKYKFVANTNIISERFIYCVNGKLVGIRWRDYRSRVLFNPEFPEESRMLSERLAQNHYENEKCSVITKESFTGKYLVLWNETYNQMMEDIGNYDYIPVGKSKIEDGVNWKTDRLDRFIRRFISVQLWDDMKTVRFYFRETLG